MGSETLSFFMKVDLGCGEYCRGDIGISTDFIGEIAAPEINALIGERNPNAKLIKHNLDSRLIPLPDNYADEVIMCHILEHLHHPWDILEEVKRIMKSGAVLKIIVPNSKHAPYDWNDPTHLYTWNEATLAHLVGKFFRVVRAEEITGHNKPWHVYVEGIKD